MSDDFASLSPSPVISDFEKAVLPVPRYAGVIAFLSASLILFEVWMDQKTGEATNYTKILFPMMLCSLLMSSAFMVGTNSFR